jgi:two-component system cell cycle response regulator DivK
MLLTVTILERVGYEVLQAGTAVQGIESAREQRPDLILMDIQLPDMDGLAAMRIVKADPVLHTIPVIALTAFTTQEDEDSLRAAGCDGYVAKPLRYKEFLAEIEAVAARHGLSPSH